MREKMPLKIIIADDHPLLVDGLKRMLEEMEDVEVPEPAGNGRLLLARLRQATADLVLLDLHMPQLDGLETLKILRKEFPQIKVLVFTNYNQPKLLREARNLGANGYLLKSCTSSTLKDAVRTVAGGGEWFREEPPAPANDSIFTDDFMKKYQVT